MTPAPDLLLWCFPSAILLCAAAVILFDRPGDRSETLACIALVFAILAPPMSETQKPPKQGA